MFRHYRSFLSLGVSSDCSFLPLTISKINDLRTWRCFVCLKWLVWLGASTNEREFADSKRTLPSHVRSCINWSLPRSTSCDDEMVSARSARTVNRLFNSVFHFQCFNQSAVYTPPNSKGFPILLVDLETCSVRGIHAPRRIRQWYLLYLCTLLFLSLYESIYSSAWVLQAPSERLWAPRFCVWAVWNCHHWW